MSVEVGTERNHSKRGSGHRTQKESIVNHILSKKDMAENFETALMEPEEREMVQYILNLIPAEDRNGLTEEDVLFVLDSMDDYLEEKGLLEYDEQTDEATYLDGDIDETEQLQYILNEAKQYKPHLTSIQIQLIMDGEKEYGLEQGYYEDID